MKKLKLLALAVVFALVGAACSSNEDRAVTDAEVPGLTTPTSASTVDPTVTIPTDVDETATEGPTVAPLFDCDVEDPDGTVEEVVGAVIYCLRQAPRFVQDEALNLLVDDSDGVFDQDIYNNLVRRYGSEAVLVVTSSTIAAVALGFNEALEGDYEETEETATEAPFEGCVDEDAVFQAEPEETLDTLTTCVREASDSDLRAASEDLIVLFGADNAAQLIQLYGIEATIVISAALGLILFRGIADAFAEVFSEEPPS